MKSIYRRTLVALAIAALPALAAAEDAFTLQPVDIYAGPDGDYPVIATLPPNTEVRVAGCLSDWSWCDVRFANDRGWIYAGELGYLYQSRRVAIIEYGSRLRLPVVTFSINSYWDAHYRSRPFFRERDQWAGRVHLEANRGGHPPHGGTSVAGRGGQSPQAQGTPAQNAGAQSAQQRERDQAAQRAQNQQRTQEAQRNQSQQRAQAEERSREANQQKAQADQGREQHAAVQRNQPASPQAKVERPQTQQAKQAQPQERAPQANARDREPQQREAQAAPQKNARPPEAARNAQANPTQRENAKENPNQGDKAKAQADRKEEHKDNG